MPPKRRKTPKGKGKGKAPKRPRYYEDPEPEEAEEEAVPPYVKIGNATRWEERRVPDPANRRLSCIPGARRVTASGPLARRNRRAVQVARPAAEGPTVDGMFARLPTDLLYNIVSRLVDSRDLLSLRGASRGLRGFVTDAMNHPEWRRTGFPQRAFDDAMRIITGEIDDDMVHTLQVWTPQRLFPHLREDTDIYLYGDLTCRNPEHCRLVQDILDANRLPPYNLWINCRGSYICERHQRLKNIVNLDPLSKLWFTAN